MTKNVSDNFHSFETIGKKQNPNTVTALYKSGDNCGNPKLDCPLQGQP